MPAQKKQKTAKGTKVTQNVEEPVSEDESDISDYSGLEDEVSDEEGDQKILTESDLKAMQPMAKKTLKKIQESKGSNDDDEGPDVGVIYLGHIPYGFFEPQMDSFFSQFGEVNRLRLARNRKSGRSKHYAFIEFEDADVASIVAEAMNNYMMFGRTLVCQVIHPAKVHTDMFARTNPVKRYRTRNVAREEHNQERTEVQQKRRMKRLLKQERKRRATLTEMGVDYEFAGYSGAVAEAAKPKPKKKGKSKKKNTKKGTTKASKKEKKETTKNKSKKRKAKSVKKL